MSKAQCLPSHCTLVQWRNGHQNTFPIMGVKCHRTWVLCEQMGLNGMREGFLEEVASLNPSQHILFLWIGWAMAFLFSQSSKVQSHWMFCLGLGHRSFWGKQLPPGRSLHLKKLHRFLYCSCYLTHCGGDQNYTQVSFPQSRPKFVKQSLVHRDC